MSHSDREPLLINQNSFDNAAPNRNSQPSQYHSINTAENVSQSRQDTVATTASFASQNRGTQDDIRVYKRRWYILILFSLMSGTQGGVWNTFGPISTTAEDAFGWTDSDIGLLTNWGPISFIISIVPLIWTLEHKGLRMACLISAFFVASGTLVRIFTMETPAVNYLMNVGQMLNGLAGPIAMAGPPTVSAVWFPPEQRTRATAVGTFFGMLGTAAGFLLGPNIVPDVHGHPNGTHLLSEKDTADRIERERSAIHLLMYIECVWACSIFVAMIVYFPNRPPRPPSTSAAVQREGFFVGIKNIVKLPQFWIVSLSYAASQGVLNCWMSVINVILKPHGIGEQEAGWIGFVATCGGCVLCLIFAVLADYLKRMMKWFVVGFYVLGTISYLVFALAVEHFLFEPSKALCWSTVVIGCSMIYASTPLIFELACEIAYPVGEGTANGMLTLLNNIFGGLFLLIMLDPNIGTMWMNWMAVGSCAVCIPLLMFLKEQYNRLDLDEFHPTLNTEYVIESPSTTVD